jgi:hypothetical protein
MLDIPTFMDNLNLEAKVVQLEDEMDANVN